MVSHSKVQAKRDRLVGFIALEWSIFAPNRTDPCRLSAYLVSKPGSIAALLARTVTAFTGRSCA